MRRRTPEVGRWMRQCASSPAEEPWLRARHLANGGNEDRFLFSFKSWKRKRRTKLVTCCSTLQYFLNRHIKRSLALCCFFSHIEQPAFVLFEPPLRILLYLETCLRRGLLDVCFVLENAENKCLAAFIPLSCNCVQAASFSTGGEGIILIFDAVNLQKDLKRSLLLESPLYSTRVM